MIDANMIKSLSVENRKKLIDYMEGLPDQVKKLIKLIILEDYMDPSISKGGVRTINNYCTIRKYLKNSSVKEVSNPLSSFYQKDYCNCMYNIYSRENEYPPKLQYKLDTILNHECFDISTLIKVEVYIGEFLKEIESDRTLMALPKWINGIADFINEIMKYKFKVYDFYTYINSNGDFQLDENDFAHMSRMHDMITGMIKSNPKLTEMHDLGSLIYTYFKDLGMESHVDKYNLFARYKYAMRYHNIPDEYIEDVYKRIDYLSTTKAATTMATDTLINTKKLSNIIDTKTNEINTLSGSQNLSETNGYIFSFKNINDYDADFLGDLAVKLGALSRDEILHYTNINPNHLTFELSDNDIGHIKNENHISIGTVYNSFNKEIRYIIESDGKFYLLFKDRMNTQIVYGISVERLDSTDGYDKPRKVMTIKESTSFRYKYIPEI